MEASRRELMEFYLPLDLPKAWGKGTEVVGADGTQFDFHENNMLAGYHFRYRKRGAAGYRHVADNHGDLTTGRTCFHCMLRELFWPTAPGPGTTVTPRCSVTPRRIKYAFLLRLSGPEKQQNG